MDRMNVLASFAGPCAATVGRHSRISASPELGGVRPVMTCWCLPGTAGAVGATDPGSGVVGVGVLLMVLATAMKRGFLPLSYEDGSALPRRPRSDSQNGRARRLPR